MIRFFVSLLLATCYMPSSHAAASLHFEESSSDLGQQTEKEILSEGFFYTEASITENASGESVKKIEQIDGYGIRHILTYDAFDRLESSVKYNSMDLKLSECRMHYDANGNKIMEEHSVLADGVVLRTFSIRWTYDSADRVLSIVESGDGLSKSTSYRYSVAGQLVETIKPDGTRIFHSYNDAGQLVKFEASDLSFAYEYSYDQQQRLVSIRDLCQGIIQTRSYNSQNQLSEEEQSKGLKIGRSYDAAGRRVGLVLPDGSKVHYCYQGSLLASVEKVASNGSSSYRHAYRYDGQGRVIQHVLPAALGCVDFEYSLQGQLSAIKSKWHTQQIGEENIDPYGHILFSMIEDGRGVRASQFEYTDDGQLAAENGHKYTYDSIYNRLSERGENWRVNGLNQLIGTSKGICKYDVNGNLIEKQLDGRTIRYVYDALDRLIRVECPAEEAMTYVYDAFDRQIEQRQWKWDVQAVEWKLQSTAHLLYDDLNEVGRMDENGVMKEFRLLGSGKTADIGAAVALELNGKIYVPLHDTVGSVVYLIESESSHVAESYSYTAFGEEEILDAEGSKCEISPLGNPWRYCSKRTDPLSKLIFFGKRHYDPSLGRWITPDPLLYYDCPNLYAFVKNDAINRSDPYGLFSIGQIWDGFVDTFFTCFYHLQAVAQNAKRKLNAELRLPDEWGIQLEKMGKFIFGEPIYVLMGHTNEETKIGFYGEKEMEKNVRVTFINGILTTRKMMHENLELISESHGNIKIHYVFRPTEGWTWDISKTLMIKMAYSLGFRSRHAHLLAQLWRELIEEIGGVEGDGVIIHYAHSLGGSETDRARDLLTPEELKKIRVITFGSPTFVRNVGFQSVVNHVSIDDGVANNYLFDPVGHVRYYFDPDLDVRFHGSPLSLPCWPIDHGMTGRTYGPLMRNLGEEFLAEFK